MAAAAIPLIITGSALGGFGGVKANLDQAKAERDNANYFLEQEQNTLLASQREEDIFRQDARDVYNAQISGFAKAGIDISGSPLLTLGETKEKTRRGIEDIRTQGENEARLARLRAESSFRQADNLSSFETNFLGFAGSLLGGAGQVASASK